MLKIYKTKSKADYFVIFFSFVYIGSKVFPVAEGLVNAAIAAAGLLCLLYFQICGSTLTKKKAYSLGLLLSCCMLISILYNGNASIENLLWIGSYLGVSLCVFEFGISNFSSIIICYGIELFFVYKAIVTGPSEILADTVLQTASNNNISTICLYASSIYYIAHVINNEKVFSYIPTILVLFVSMYYANRGGMIAAGVLLLGLFINNIRQEGLSWKNLIVLLPAIIIIVYFFYKNFSVFGAALAQKLERDGGESSRTVIWSEYIRGCFDDFFHFLFGVPANLREYPTYFYYKGNAHNAFLILHSKFGLIPFVLVIKYIISCGLFLIKKGNYVLCLVLLSIVIRSMLDWTAFPGILDVIFWFFVLVVINKNVSSPKMIKVKQIK